MGSEQETGQTGISSVGKASRPAGGGVLGCGQGGLVRRAEQVRAPGRACSSHPRVNTQSRVRWRCPAARRTGWVKVCRGVAITWTPIASPARGPARDHPIRAMRMSLGSTAVVR